jgi:Ran GTPase-activating protein (RanGAP) involved in mRNA processing and transport
MATPQSRFPPQGYARCSAAHRRMEGAHALAKCLRVNRALVHLNVSQNTIGDAGALRLAKSLLTNATLTWLDLHDNPIGACGAAKLAECLRVNATLKHLDLWGCGKDSSMNTWLEYLD